jgi:prepilin-type N-terminal cleavage/methylation domain-containing protein
MRNALTAYLRSRKNRFSLPRGGFTLVEMAIVIVILGMIISGGFQLYLQWLRHERAVKTSTNVNTAVAAITTYRDLYGHYPCPAPLTASRDAILLPSTPQASYGVSTDCTAVTGDYALGGGVSAAGIARVSSLAPAHIYTDIDTNTPLPPRVPVVRVGALPFRTLNMDENAGYDGYQNRLYYAVTEELTDPKIFDPAGGGIGIGNESGSLVTPANTAHFIIFSAGENGAGAYTRGGARLPCANGALESENCNFATDPAFELAQQATIGEGQTSQFDDVVAYATHKDIPLWRQGADPANPYSMSPKVSGGVGIGPDASQNPDEALQVQGILKAEDDPNTLATAEGNLNTSSICEYDPTSTTCFSSSLIAGDLVAGTGGMTCPPGQFMVGIKNGLPVCKDDIVVNCPNNSILEGINNDGTLKCTSPPPKCPTETRNICGTDKTLFESYSGTEIVLTGGASYQAAYRCENGEWKSKWSNGLCTCTPQTFAARNVSCADYGGGCGAAYTGNKKVQDEYTCPYGQTVTRTVDTSDCTCIPSTSTWTEGCPNGMNSGNVVYTKTNICDASPHCSAPVQTANTCKCVPQVYTYDSNCPSGMEGRIKNEEKFTCPDGEDKPGKWNGWYIAENTCKCKASSYTRTDSCPQGQVGEIKTQVSYSCPDMAKPPVYSETLTSNTCKPAPIVTCKWQIQGTGVTQNFSLATKDGDDCTCGSGITSCTASIGNGQYRLSNCTCQ